MAKQTPIQIRREQPAFKSMDFAFLKQQGMDLAQQLSGAIWTDYNSHDPGLTIMEQLCFAITDLSYRTDFKIQDLLNAKTSRRERKALNNTFFDASEVLPNTPISLEDYRILLIDRIEEVKNAWVLPVRDNLQGIQGLYRVLLQIDEDAVKNTVRVNRIRQEVQTLFAQHRNLCEDLESVQELGTEGIEVFADVEIAADAIGEEVLATMLFRLEEHLNPTIRFYTVEELQAEGLGIDEIFDGPPPMNGFIRKAELKPMRQEVYVSKLMEILSSVEGVRRITYFRVEKNGIPVEGDVIPIEMNAYPVLNMDTIDTRFESGAQPYPVQFSRGSLRYDTDLNTVNQLLYSLYAQYKKGYQMKKIYDERNFPSVLKASEIPKYHSMQLFFPITYGLHPMGLPNGVRLTRERKGMIKQLRGYLLVFEQIMANYLAQLAHVQEFFSLNKGVDRSYYSQIPDSVPFLSEIIRSKSMEEFKGKLESLVAEFDPFLDRRNRTLDHLLARFGEQFQTDFLIRLGSRNLDKDQGEAMLIDAKIDFLQNYVELSRDRSRGFNYLEGRHTETWNVSGLEKRLSLQVRINPSGNVSLLRALDGALPDLPALEEKVRFIDPSFLSFLSPDFIKSLGEEDENGETKALAREDKGVTYEASYFQFPYADRQVLLNQLMQHGLQAFNYLMVPIEGEEAAGIYYSGDKKLGVYKVAEASDLHQARLAINDFVSYLFEISRMTEGLHLVEHILLRPQAKDRHGFQLVNDQERVLLKSHALGDLADQRHLSEELPNLGAESSNYHLEKQANGKYLVTLRNSYGNILGRLPEDFDDEMTAKAEMEDVVDYINSFRAGGISIFSNVHFFMEQRKQALVDDEFYSFAMSMVLPAWPHRFKNTDFKKIFMSSIMLNIPVHLQAKVLWLNVHDMAEFEQLYFAWLDVRASTQPEQPDLDDAAYELTNWLGAKIREQED